MHRKSLLETDGLMDPHFIFIDRSGKSKNDRTIPESDQQSSHFGKVTDPIPVILGMRPGLEKYPFQATLHQSLVEVRVEIRWNVAAAWTMGWTKQDAQDIVTGNTREYCSCITTTWKSCMHVHVVVSQGREEFRVWRDPPHGYVYTMRHRLVI